MAAVAMTGGTAAPGSGRVPGRVPGIGKGSSRGAARRQAAQRAVKAPRVIGQRPQRATATHAPKLAGHAPKAQTPQAPKGPAAFNPAQGFLNSQQLGKLAGQITRQNMSNNLAPLRQEAKEITGTQATVANRYSGYSNATNSLLSGISQDAEAGAKTFENQAADAALKAGEGINQTGQTATSQNGGYLDPQVQAELNAQGKLATGVASGQNQLAASTGASETGFMGNLRAAAAQRALEGQKSINTLYGQQLAKNEGEQSRLIAKQPAEAKSLAVELGQKQFTDYATAKTLGIKQQTANLDGQKVKLTAQQNHEKDRLTERGQNITATKNAAQTRIDERKIAETERHDRANEQSAALKAQAEMKKANGGLTTNEQDKVAGQIGTAYNVVQQLREAKVTPQEIRDALTTGNLRRDITATNSSGKTYTKEVTYKYPKIDNQALVTAAFELWDWHKVKPAVVNELKAMGVNVPAGWTNGSFKGF